MMHVIPSFANLCQGCDFNNSSALGEKLENSWDENLPTLRP